MVWLLLPRAWHAEQEMLDVTGPNWLKRVGMLQELGLQPVIQFTAACGLHPDLVTRLGLVYIEGQLEESATPPVTWDVWLAVARKGRGLESFVSRALPTPPQGEDGSARSCIWMALHPPEQPLLGIAFGASKAITLCSVVNACGTCWRPF